jgi:hypothetical protein
MLFVLQYTFYRVLIDEFLLVIFSPGSLIWPSSNMSCNGCNAVNVDSSSFFTINLINIWKKNGFWWPSFLKKEKELQIQDGIWKNVSRIRKKTLNFAWGLLQAFKKVCLVAQKWQENQKFIWDPSDGVCRLNPKL